MVNIWADLLRGLLINACIGTSSLKIMTREHLISCCCDLFGYSDTDFDDMNYDEILDYLTDSQKDKLKEYNE